MSLPTPEGVTYGLVVARWLQIVGDTPADPDALPDTKPMSGSALFTRKQKTTIRADSTQPDGTYVGIAKQNINGYLRTVDGELARAADSSDTGLWLVTGIYTVSFVLSGTTWPSFDIEVTAEHTLSSPLDLITATPYVPPIGVTPVVIMVPASIPDGYLLAKNGGSVVGVDPASFGGVGNVPEASTTVKGVAELATSVETVTGDDATRATTPAGVKAALDARSVSDMSMYVAPTGTDDRLQVAGVDVEPEQVGAAPALGSDDNYVTDAEKTVIGNTSGVNTGDQDLSGLLTTTDAPELFRDVMVSALVAGANVTITPDDGEDTITISATGGAAEQPPLFGPIPNLITSWGVGGFSNVAPLGYGNITMLVYRIERAVTIDALIFRVATLDAAATATAVLYRGDDVTGLALTRMALTDSVALTTTGDYVMPVTPVALTPGIYWATVLADKTDVAKVAGKFVSLPLNYSTILNDQFGQNNTYPKVPCPNPPPSTMTFANNSISGKSYMPHVILRRPA